MLEAVAAGIDIGIAAEIGKNEESGLVWRIRVRFWIWFQSSAQRRSVR